jgi:hypothetical protein
MHSAPPDDRKRPVVATDPSPWPYLYGLSEAHGEMKADMAQIKIILKEMNEKLDDLIKWKTMILGGVAVILGLSGALAYVSAKYSITFVERPAVVLPPPR